MTIDPINTPEGLLWHLLRRNAHGVWFVKVDEERYATLPRWLWGHCERALPGVQGVEGKP